MAEFKIEGLAETSKALQELGDKIVKRALRKALQAGINVMGKEVMARTPTATGLLKESVGTKVKITKEGEAGLAVVGFGNQGHVARWIEYGHRVVGHKPKKKDTGEHVPARPFIRPAFEATKDKAVEQFTEVINDEIAKHKK